MSNAYFDISTLDEPQSLDSEVDVAIWLLEHEGLVFNPDRHLRIVSSVAMWKCPSLLTEGN